MKKILRILKVLLIPALLLSLSACTMIPEYQKPDMPIPEEWPEGPAYLNHNEEPDIAQIPWQEFFQDEKLQSLIQLALDNNKDIKLAALNVEKLRVLYKIQESELLPKVHGGAAGSKQRLPADLSPTGQAMTSEQYGLEVGVASWELDIFGRLRSLKAKALEDFLATEHARRSIRLMLISEVSQAYMKLVMDRENLDLARSTLQSQEDYYKLIKRRFDVGLAHELELRQVQTRVESARLDIAIFTEKVAQDLNALEFIAGSNIDRELLAERLDDIKPLKDISPGLSSAILLQRPDISQAENRLKAANANIGAARAAFFPHISLTGSFGTASSELTGLFSSGSASWLFSPRLNVPIFNPGIWSGLKVSKLDREIALTQYEKTIQSAFRDVSDILAQRGTLDAQIRAQSALRDACEQSYKLSNARYEKGSDTYLGVLDAQRSLYSSQQGLIAIRLAKLANQVRLYASLGGGAGELEIETKKEE